MRSKWLIIIILNILLFSNASYASKKKILVLHSYHQGLNWTDNISRGMLSVFKQFDDLEIQFEYMDTKRNNRPEYLEEFSKLYNLKHHNIPFEAVIASDNNALEFVKKYRDTFFKDIPIIFTAIDQFDKSMIEGIKDITGVSEFIDFKKTIELALKFHPDIKNLVVINDNITKSAIINRNHFKEFWPELKTKVNLIFIENLSIDELIKSVKALNETNIILLLNFSQDKAGNYISYQENIEIIRNVTNLPIYSSWEFYLDEGIVGGMLTSGFYQGKLAAEIALKVVNGVDINTIPIVDAGYNKYMFDYKMLTRYGIRLNQLPEGSIIVNQPPTLYERYKIYLFLVITFIILLVLTLVIARAKRRNAERKFLKENQELEESKSRLLRMLDASSDGVWEHDLVTGKVEISEQIWANLGYTDEEISNTKEFVVLKTHPLDRAIIERNRTNYLKGETTSFVAEFRLRSKDNGWIWYKARGKVFDRDEKSSPISLVGTLNDISLRKEAEKEIQKTEGKILNAIINTEEEERKRFSKDLHDTIGPLISSINLYLSALEGDVKKERKEEIIKVSREVVSEVLVNLKEISNNLSPHILSDFGLEKALESFVENIKLSQSINIKLDIKNLSERIEEQVEVIIYRVIIELINNTIKHADAENIEISITRAGSKLKLIYIDDGKGFDTNLLENTSSRGMGLYNIYSRIKSLNGTCVVKSNKNIGGMMTVIEIILKH